MASLELPESGASFEEVRLQFKRIARKMRVNRKTRLAPNRRSRLPNEHLKRSAYELLSHYLRNEYHHTFVLVLSELGRIPKTSIQPTQNPFFWGLLAVCGHDDIFSMNQLRRIAKGMHCAYERNIPTDQIIEFLEDRNSLTD